MAVDVNSLGERSAEFRSAFRDAAAWFSEATALATHSLDAPSLGEWTVHDLVGHTSRAVTTVETYLTENTRDPVEVSSSVGYFLRALETDPAQIAARGREAGRSLGTHPGAAISEEVSRVLDRVAAAADAARVRTPVGTMVLAEYLPTRTFELVVHTGDLLRALGAAPHGPENATRSALRLACELAEARGYGAALLASLTGRLRLADDFTVL